MSNHTKGTEPRCPLQFLSCLGVIKERTAKSCVNCYKHTRRQDAQSTATSEIDSRTETADGVCVLTKTSKERIVTLKDLVRVCEIDLEQWDVERYTCNKWEMAAMPKTTGSSKNWVRGSTDPIITPIYQIKATLRRRSVKDQTLKTLSAELLSDIRAEVSASPAIVTRQFVEGDWLFEFSPFDLHMGKYTWDEETVTNYDTDIAADLFDASIDFLLNRAMKLTDGKLGRILCVFGNDVSHVDSKKGQTTAGTPLDVDTRYIRVYRRICAIHRRAIDVLRTIAPVDIKIVPGNHDELTSFHLGELLTARYENTSHVTVDNSPRLRKYYDYGVNLFGFTHGDSERVNELPLTMAREQPELWAKCSSREWHIGHKHISEKVEARSRPGHLEQDFFSDKGVRIRRLTSLSGHDAWHTKHAYMDRRACEAFVFHKDAGFTDHLSFNVDHFTGKAVSK